MNAKRSKHSPLDLRCTKSGPRLKVWWIPQVPMTEFEVFVDSFVAAKVLLESLAKYDLFQLEQHIKGDYSNAGGLCVWDESLEPDEHGSKWTSWESDDFREFDDLTLAECAALDAKTEAAA